MVIEIPMAQRETKIKPTHDIRIFTGRANSELAGEIADYLGTNVGPMIIKNFSDGEIYVQIQESVRGDDVFIVQPLCDPNKSLIELLIIIDAFKRASAKSITAVIPYYAYARQDRKAAGREAISAKLVADLLTTAGADRILAMDLHTGQIQGFFNILVDHIYATPILIKYLKEKEFSSDIVIVSPDAGGVERARAFAKKLNAPLAIVDKRRQAHNIAEVENLIGDVKGKTAILIDDMIDTAGTITEGAKLLIKEGASEVYVCAAHPLFSGPALERLEKSPIKEVIVTNTLPLKPHNSKKIVQLSIANLLGEAIARIHDDESVSSLFE
jgi:ribose-phosphate pyrophosphokinase